MQSLLCVLFLLMGLLLGCLVDFIALFLIYHIQNDENNENGKSARRDGIGFSKTFLLLKGRWSSCGAKTRGTHLLVVLTNGLLAMIVYMANGLDVKSILYLLMTSAFLVISIVDENTFEIPLPCNLFIGGLGIIMCVYDLKNIASYLIGFVCISMALYLLYLVSGGALIGGGDVKLMAAAGLLLGWKKVTLAFFIACILGAFIHVIRMKTSGKERMLAMGPYLCAGLWICALWGEQMITWYLGKLGF